MRYRWFTNRFVDGVVLLNRTFLGAVLISISAGLLLGQQKYEDPRSFSLADLSQDRIDRKVLPPVDVDRLLAEDRARRQTPIGRGPDRFAVAAKTAFTLKNSGTWENVPDGRLWRLRIQSPRAKSINLGIIRYEMPAGAKLWLYDLAHRNVRGPYTSEDRSHQGSLWTALVPGDEIVVEVFLPKNTREPVIVIGSVNRGYRDLGGPRDLILSCENDVICPEGDPWRDQIRSVAKYSIDGVDVCSGQLMNNTSWDRTPYFLSAEHCDVDSTNDASMVVYWNFESPTCGVQSGGSLADNQTGAIFRASNVASDFVLVQLEEMPDAAFNVYYSGWDVTGTAAASSVGIHHPNAEVKSISFNTNAVTSTANGSNTVNAAANHWRVDSFDDGAVEHGSSGSCLWDVASKRCIGQLHSGFPGCPGGPYWYGKLSASWTGGGTNSTRLSNWLDPAGGGATMTLDGDPHITTANGTRYDFQGAGEFVSLRDLDGLEVQTRMTAISTDFTPGADGYHGLATCVSINSAVAARVGRHRVTIQPNITGVPDPSGLQVRIDGVLTAVGAGGVNLGPGARIDKFGDAFQVTFPNGSVLMVTPLFWNSQGKWFLNVEVVRNGSDGMGGSDPGSFGFSGGLMSALAPGSWLPALADGTSLGPMPSSLNQRYTDLYQKFGESWRVTDRTSLFDYAAGTSTATFTDVTWPRLSSSCKLPASPSIVPIRAEVARRLCRGVVDKNTNAHCVYDVMNTGEPAFAKLYLQKQRIRSGFTTTNISVSQDPVPVQERITFTAVVSKRLGGPGAPAGSVRFIVDGREAAPVKLDAKGIARHTVSGLRVGKHQLVANYLPAAGSESIASSRERTFTVSER